ncbi:MAG: beta-N-acetylhexosaminidase, partial [Pedobacter sp.]
GELPQAIFDNNLCPANENVYRFLDDVIKEVAELFPFPYIHMGGDETSTNYWEKSAAVSSLMQRENLQDMHAVQGYFSKRVKALVEKNGKEFMGWDEILTGGLPSDAAVMAWRKPEKGIEASLKKHKVVMTPFTHTYLDLMQADAITEVPVYKEVRLNKAYQFEPIPEGANTEQIMGGQANLWTEQVYNIRQAEYMTWPRAMAISESLWSAKETKNWPGFVSRVEKHFDRLDVSETKYARSVYDPIFSVSKSSGGQIQVSLSTEIDGLDIYYSFDNSFPDRFYPKYTQPLNPPSDATLLRVITYRGKQPVGRMQNMPVDELMKRAGKK